MYEALESFVAEAISRAAAVANKKRHVCLVFDSHGDRPNPLKASTKKSRDKQRGAALNKAKKLLCNHGRKFQEQAKKYASFTNDVKALIDKVSSYSTSHVLPQVALTRFIDNGQARSASI